jgi:hypothetical protein
VSAVVHAALAPVAAAVGHHVAAHAQSALATVAPLLPADARTTTMLGDHRLALALDEDRRAAVELDAAQRVSVEQIAPWAAGGIAAALVLLTAVRRRAAPASP